jgi:hypothetical protein
MDIGGGSMVEKEIECMECGMKFFRDISLPKWKKVYSELGCVADQCDECLTKYLKEMME